MNIVMFDLDGTLLDTASFAVGALREAVDSINRERGNVIVLPSDEAIRRCFGLPISEYYRSLLTPWSEELEEAIHRQAMSLQCQMLANGKASLYEGIEDLLCELRRRGVRPVVVSCASRAYLNAVRSHLLAQHVDVWISAAEHATCDKKEAMREFIWAVCDKPLAVVGDRRIDMDAARCVGATAIGCLYGYGSSGELISADYLAATPDHLAEIVLRLTGHRDECGPDSRV